MAKIVICVFTDKADIAEGEPTPLIGAAIEAAIGRLGQQVSDYYGFKEPRQFVRLVHSPELVIMLREWAILN